MKPFRVMLLLGVLVFYSQIALASGADVSIEEADSLRNFTLNTTPDDALDSTDATPQETFIDVFVSDADSTRKSDLCEAPEDALDSAPKITSCDSDGNEKNRFVPGKNVSVKGEDLKPNTNYSIWIQNDPVGEGYQLNASEDPSLSQENVTTDATGSFGPIVIWSIPAGEPVTHHEYDIVVNKRDDGTNTSIYNFASDGIDSADVAGIVAPVPELPSSVLFAAGLMLIVGIMRFRRKD
jgi:hypothetical protein